MQTVLIKMDCLKIHAADCFLPKGSTLGSLLCYTAEVCVVVILDIHDLNCHAYIYIYADDNASVLPCKPG